MRARSAADVLAAQEAWKLTTLVASVDGTVIPRGGVGAAISGGTYEHVPVIEGSNHDEWALFVAFYLAAANIQLRTELDY